MCIDGWKLFFWLFGKDDRGTYERMFNVFFRVFFFMGMRETRNKIGLEIHRFSIFSYIYFILIYVECFRLVYMLAILQ